MTVKLTYDGKPAAFLDRMLARHDAVARAATAAMKDASERLKADARAAIAKAGFGRRWQNTLRTKVFPVNKASVDAAVFMWHKIPYAGVFETGAAISGRPLLWVPLDGTPKRIGRRRLTPASFTAATGQKLVRFKSRDGRPLLGATVRMSKARAAADRPKVSLSLLKRGTTGRGILKTIPLFVGIDRITLRGRFGISGVAARVRDRLPELYARNFSDD